MLLVFFLSTVIRNFSSASLIPDATFTSGQNSTTIDSANCQYPSTSQRSTWGILWSCLSTTFLVTWVSVHPNIPSPGEKWWWIYWRRVKAVFWALIAPELVILWAWRQRRGARLIMVSANEIVKEHKIEKEGSTKSCSVEVSKWSMVHGHFLQMGGFLICEKGAPPRTMQFGEFLDLLKAGWVELSQITLSKDEIMDRSKSDGLSKGIAVGQTFWFIAQVIARRTQHLAVTPLELTTLALASLNWIAFILWWDKPYDVQCPVKIDIPETWTDTVSVASEFTPFRETSTGPQAVINPVTVGEEIPESKDDCQTEEKFQPRKRIIQTIVKIWHSGQGQLLSVLHELSLAITEPVMDIYKSIFKRLQQERDTFGHFLGTFVLISQPISGPFNSLLGANHMLDGERYCPKDRVGIFYACGSPSILIRSLIATIAGCMFAGLHLIGWHADFPTSKEQHLWGIASILMMTAPLLTIINFLFQIYRIPRGSIKFIIHDGCGVILLVLMVLNIFLCIPARIFLLMEGVAALRRLPTTAYEAVDWTLKTPHI